MGALRLDEWLAVMANAEPFQVLENRFNELRPAATGVEILDPQAEPAAARPGMGMTENRRKCVAKVKPPRGRRGKTCDLQDSLHAKGAHGDS